MPPAVAIERRHATATGAILFDAARLPQGDPALLDTARWPATSATGRAAVHRVEGGFGYGILRHYRRGGLIGRFNRDLYWWTGEEATRAFREFRLLIELQSQGLPVPAALAAGYRRVGPFYRADLLTEELPQTRTLAAGLREFVQTPTLWRHLGHTLARFHSAGVWHADLNAHNVLLDPRQDWWLIDFDRGRLREPHLLWAHSRLDRLHRSLTKLGASALPNWTTVWHTLRTAHDEAFGHSTAP